MSLHDPFNRTRLPADFSRDDRVLLLGELCTALVNGEQPPRRAALFVAGAVLAWLDQGGDLARDYLRVTSPRGSHVTPAALWRALRDEAPHRDERQADALSVASRSSELERTA